MTKKSQRIKTIVDLKATQEQDSLEALGASQRKLLAMQAQVESLKKYRQEYQGRFNQLGSVGTNVEQLLEFRSFMDKLDKAITGQEHSLELCKSDLITKRKIWESMHHRTKGLQKIYNTALTVEIKQESKSEQLEQDERASRLGRNSSGNLKNA
jgi:flagellar protein FliJ